MGDVLVPNFEPWPKISRLKSASMLVTEKLDGTNAQIYITQDGRVFAGSRTRWLLDLEAKGGDNFGFGRWVQLHREELLQLGPGRHYGEWWGVGIQRGYDLSERRFSLFNTDFADGKRHAEKRPACVSVVPLLHAGAFDIEAVEALMNGLGTNGSHAAPGYMKPEGLCVYVLEARVGFKRTFDERHKGEVTS